MSRADSRRKKNKWNKSPIPFLMHQFLGIFDDAAKKCSLGVKITNTKKYIFLEKG
jgi:hypothetical protein